MRPGFLIHLLAQGDVKTLRFVERLSYPSRDGYFRCDEFNIDKADSYDVLTVTMLWRKV